MADGEGDRAVTIANEPEGAGRPFDVMTELRRAGLSSAWLREVDRSTLWRWVNRRTDVPKYVQTVIRQQQLVMTLLGNPSVGEK